MAATLANLLAFCRSQAVIEATNYFDPKARDHDPAGVAAYRQDYRERSQSRALCYASFPGRLNKGTEPLVPGTYGRLTIHAAGKIEYIVGQYAPLEIYGALYDYLKETNYVF
jgi:hypothetical protein